jgi:hypothetical protein
MIRKTSGKMMGLVYGMIVYRKWGGRRGKEKAYTEVTESTEFTEKRNPREKRT